ncbi:hypothetical protein BJAS_P3448 [Bathymodiolus japonicus methanotrophic gill symbiont]|uniref:major capsid protein n=1 Tax=Bathymodiolus japonicus methanotrophic gill symbiont TaxID=113269 RepID=UPI001B799D9D|nr:hypothetical protein [Bathymodiolus japonicus methanotrophic gill symbiont]GFO72911.1 hypothetical protein BJAS_P3448 [Bathymodiolus japonicus methanotrophic gill symbiont]
MATIGNTFGDLVDMYQQNGSMNSTVPVINMLTEHNPMLMDAIAIECNRGLGHLHTVVTGMPTNSWGRLYKGVGSSKSGKIQVTDTTAYLQARSEVASDLLMLMPDPASYRLKEATLHFESMKQEVASKLFYGNVVGDPDQFTGFAPRFNDKSAINGDQIIDAGGNQNKNTSIWFVTWSDTAAALLYPKGTMAGVQHQDMGEQRVLDATGLPYYVKEDMFRWDIGLSIEDWRYVVRIANVDIDAVKAGTIDIYKYLRMAHYRHWGRTSPMGKTAIYCNTEVLELLDAQNTNSTTGDNYIRLRPGELDGKEVMTYRGYSLRESNALLNNEANVT